jgi:hypothetical protein
MPPKRRGSEGADPRPIGATEVSGALLYVMGSFLDTYSGEDDWRTTNANLYPHIDDYGLIAIKNNEVVESGYLDDHWK